MDECAYRTTDPEILGIWQDAVDRYEDWRNRVSAFDERFPGFHSCHTNWHDGLSVIGLVPDDGKRGDPPTPVGWRWQVWKGRWLLHGSGCWMPHKGRLEGKAFADEIAELQVKRLGVLPGMPKELHVPDGGNRWRSHSSFRHDGVVYVRWSGMDADYVEAQQAGVLQGDRLDLSRWERCKMSEYHAAHEALQDAA